MTRKATVPPTQGAARRRSGPTPAPAENVAGATSQASLPPERFMASLQQVGGAQLAAAEACTAALRDAVDAALRAREPAQFLSAQNEFLRRTMTEVVRCQAELLRTGLSLQSELAQGWAAPVAALVPGWGQLVAGPAVLGATGLESTFGEARQRFEETAQQWFDAWTVAETPNAVVA